VSIFDGTISSEENVAFVTCHPDMALVEARGPLISRRAMNILEATPMRPLGQSKESWAWRLAWLLRASEMRRPRLKHASVRSAARWPMAACLALGMIYAVPAQAQGTTIHVVFQGYYERVRPGYAAGITTEKFDLVLSGGNSLQQTFNGSNALGSKTSVTEQTLGGNRWRVAGPHRLIGTENLPQSVRTMTIDVEGKTCKASWTQRLVPGFTEYNIYSIPLGQFAFYKQARMVSSTCEIE
jgi:hypothetical protein